MATRTRRVVTLTALFTTSLMIFLSGATTADARGGPKPKPVVDTSRAGDIKLTVSSKRSTVGSPGSDGTAGTKPLRNSVPAPCWMRQDLTGLEAYQFVLVFPIFVLLYTDSEQHKDDVKGHWYVPTCDFANWPDPNDIAGFRTFEDDFHASHPAVYVEANETPPTPKLSPKELRAVAIANLPLPDPKLDWNPKLTGRGTLVNLDTWFWLIDPPPTTLTVTAAVPGSQASVTVTFAGMDISATGEKALHCPGPGTPYTAGAEPTCFLEFRRASSALGLTETPVRVATRWTGTWTADGVDQGALDPQPAPITATANIRVDEIQTLVTGAR